jgi:hypothetical protein
LDQTLGKPGSYLAGIDRAGNVKPMTIGARLYRVEQQVSKSQLHVTHECRIFNDSDLRDFLTEVCCRCSWSLQSSQMMG